MIDDLDFYIDRNNHLYPSIETIFEKLTPEEQAAGLERIFRDIKQMSLDFGGIDMDRLLNEN